MKKCRELYYDTLNDINFLIRKAVKETRKYSYYSKEYHFLRIQITDLCKFKKILTNNFNLIKKIY